MSFPEAFLRRRRREPMDERLPDGRSVQELLMESRMRGQERLGARPSPYEDAALAQTPNPQVLTPQNQQAITRPRTVTPAPQPPQEPAQQGGSFVDAFTRPRRTQPRDYVADDAAYLRDLNKQGRTWRDKIVDVTDALNAVAGGPKRVLPTKRERALQKAESQLGLDVEMQKQALGQLVPVTLENGQQVMVPARQAGTLTSQQQAIHQRGEDAKLRSQMNDARKSHWNNMDARDRKRNLISLYNSGALNDPDLLDYAADELGIPGPLREKFIAGRLRGVVTNTGELATQNLQTNQVTGTGTQSYEATKEAGRQRRFNVNQDRLRNPPVKPTTTRPDKAANALVSKYNYLRKAEMSTDIPVETKPEIQRRREAVWQQIMDTYPGMFEADEKTFELRPKAGAQQQSAPSGGVSEAAIRAAAAAKGLDPDTAVQRAKARKLIP